MEQPTAVRARRARRFGDSGAPINSVRDALRECRLLFGFVLVFGVAVNLLLLTGPLYMLQVYDRVLTSNSFQTLMALSLLVVAAYLALGMIDRSRWRSGPSRPMRPAPRARPSSPRPAVS